MGVLTRVWQGEHIRDLEVPISAQSDLLLPQGSRLLHIGPHKTGTSAVQSAFHLARPMLARHGVHYAGVNRQPMFEAMYATGSRGRRPGDPEPDPADWNRLVREVRTTSATRVVISSEMFDDARKPQIASIVDALGGDAVHVVLTLRPLAEILPSAWQQSIRNKRVFGYEEWLDCMFNQPPYRKPTPSFWFRHSHDKLVRRWVGIVGADRVTVVIGDKRDPSALTAAFEQMTGLPAGTLVSERGHTNRSLTLAETELLRRVNVEFVKRDWSDLTYARAVRARLVPAMQRRTPGEQETRTLTPEWAVRAAGARGAAAAIKIAATGVRIVGDISVLGSTEVATAAPASPDSAAVPGDTAFDVLLAAWVAPPPQLPGGVKDLAVKQVRAVDLMRVLVRGLRARVVARLRGARGRSQQP